MLKLNVARLRQEIESFDGFRTVGRLRSAGETLSCTLRAAVGSQCRVFIDGREPVGAEVIGFDRSGVRLLPYERPETIRPGTLVVDLGRPPSVPVGDGLLGRVVDGLGRPVDGKGPLGRCRLEPLRFRAPAPLERAPITRPFVTGLRAIDALITCGHGQRVGLFSGSGVGKSTLLGEIAKHAQADLNVIALVGERGREVKPFLQNCLGSRGLQRSAVVVATAEHTPLVRVRAAQAAVTMADYFRRQGAHVVLLLDSITRLAMAQRQIGLSLGEPPSARGYTPSVFQLLADIFEQMGNADQGSVTGIVTVLVDGDDLDEPISDAARSLVDGHVVLDRKLAERAHYPPIDVSRSVSRVFVDVTEPRHRQAAARLRAIMACYAEVADLIRIGAYVKGSSPQVDKAVELMPAIEAFLKQPIGQSSSLSETVAAMERLTAHWNF